MQENMLSMNDLEVYNMSTILIKNTANGDTYTIYTKLSKDTFIVNMDGERVLIECSPTTPYKEIRI